MKREPVTSERDQDKWLHRLLRQRSATQQAVAPTSACLDADLLAAWADGALDAKAQAAAEVHVAACPRCLALLAAIERTAPVVAAEPHPRRLWLRWLVPLTAAATAVAIWIAIPQRQVTPVAREAAPAPVVPSAAPPVEASQSGTVPQEGPGARVDDLQAQNRVAREERALADKVEVAESARERDSAAADQSTFATPASPSAPAPPASASVQRKALNKEAVTDAVSPDSPLVRWRVLSGTEVERSTDGGKTWTRTSKPPAPISSIRVVDTLTATVTTPDGRSFSTTDGGATWAPVQEKPPAPF